MIRVLAIVVALVLGSCSDGGKQRPRPQKTSKPGRSEPAKPRHGSHEHGHGDHPHDKDAHHHHPHPHPHLDGVKGHHHPY